MADLVAAVTTILEQCQWSTIHPHHDAAKLVCFMLINATIPRLTEKHSLLPVLYNDNLYLRLIFYTGDITMLVEARKKVYPVGL